MWHTASQPASQLGSLPTAPAGQTLSFKLLYSHLTNADRVIPKRSDYYVLAANKSIVVLSPRLFPQLSPRAVLLPTRLPPPHARRGWSLYTVRSWQCGKTRWAWAVPENPKKTFSSVSYWLCFSRRSLTKETRGVAAVHIVSEAITRGSPSWNNTHVHYTA